MGRDLQQLQGDWSIQSLEIDGNPLPPAAFDGAGVSVSGQTFTTKSMGALYEGRLELDEQSIPPRLSMHFDAGPETGRVNHGIYELNGDVWRICLCMTGGLPPPSFSTAGRSGYALQSLVRAPATRDPRPVLEGEPVSELQGEWAMVSCVRAGETLPAAFARSGRRTVQGVRSTLRFGSQIFMDGLLTADGPPRCCRLVSTLAASNGDVQLGIFDIEGETLLTCFGAAGRPRPAKFESTREGGETCAVWTRVR